MSSIQAGDVVVCVDAELHPDQDPSHLPYLRQLKQGRFYKVTALSPRGGGIFIDGAASRNQWNGYGWYADRFRKVQKADDSFIAQIKACRPNLDRVPHNVESDRG